MHTYIHTYIYIMIDLVIIIIIDYRSYQSTLLSYYYYYCNIIYIMYNIVYIIFSLDPIPYSRCVIRSRLVYIHRLDNYIQLASKIISSNAFMYYQTYSISNTHTYYVYTGIRVTIYILHMYYAMCTLYSAYRILIL